MVPPTPEEPHSAPDLVSEGWAFFPYYCIRIVASLLSHPYCGIILWHPAMASSLLWHPYCSILLWRLTVASCYGIPTVVSLLWHPYGSIRTVSSLQSHHYYRIPTMADSCQEAVLRTKGLEAVMWAMEAHRSVEGIQVL